MRVNVKLYGPFSLMTGRNEFTMDDERTDIRVQDFLVLLAKMIPKFKQAIDGIDLEKLLRERLLLVINGEPCFDTLKMIHNGDKVQVLTPVAGG